MVAYDGMESCRRCERLVTNGEPIHTGCAYAEDEEWEREKK